MKKQIDGKAEPQYLFLGGDNPVQKFQFNILLEEIPPYPAIPFKSGTRYCNLKSL
jgi:hypothetical protein